MHKLKHTHTGTQTHRHTHHWLSPASHTLATPFHKHGPHIPSPSSVCLGGSYFSGCSISIICSLHLNLIHIVSLKKKWGKMTGKNEFIPVLSSGPCKRHQPCALGHKDQRHPSQGPSLPLPPPPRSVVPRLNQSAPFPAQAHFQCVQ